jgi:hypothetical protein
VLPMRCVARDDAGQARARDCTALTPRAPLPCWSSPGNGEKYIDPERILPGKWKGASARPPAATTAPSRSRAVFFLR